jgi:hypothetical protein
MGARAGSVMAVRCGGGIVFGGSWLPKALWRVSHKAGAGGVIM